jgi:O-antigen biosynthesis protein WbqP
MIKVDSKGPAFFVQTRQGQDGKLFSIFKFRSMKSGTPDIATDLLSDPSIYTTKIGRFLRQTSLDELPQLWNILLGDMSFIGPRPSLFNQYKLNQERIRLGITQIKPGLTGYAQIMGRDFITDEQKLEFDKFYLDHMTLILDIQILCTTFIQVVRSENVRNNS